MGGVAAPFVGRTAERDVVAKAILEVESGRSAVVVVEGEAGIGKTRLVDEVVTTLPPGITVKRAVAQELERNRPFGAVADALGVNLRSPDPDRAGIARLLWAPPGGPSGDAVSVAAGPGLHYRVVEALLLLIEMRARTGPLLVTIEDLQWCDPSSLLTLSSVRRRLRHLPVALLLTRRPTPQSVEIQPALDGLLADGGRHLVLGPLDGPDTEALAQAVSGYPPGETLRRQLPRARGNPLLIIELLRALQFEDALVIEDGRAELSHSDLPARLHVMLLRRLSYLGKDALELLRLAAVLGPSFEVGHLAAVARRSVVELLPLLDEAVAAGVFGDSGARLVFRHDLIREAIYNDVPPAIRRGLHREVGEALAAAGAPAVQVAEHLSLGATPGDTRAVRWLHRAGRDTMVRAPGEAVALLERAVELAPHDHDDRAAILADLALATLWAGRLPDAERAARALLAHGHHSDIDGGVRLVLIMALLAQGRSFEATTEAAIGVSQPGLPPRARAQLWAYAAYGPLFTGDLDTASARAEEARAEGVRLDDPVSESVALNALGMVATLQGRVAEGVGLAGEALDCADRMPGNTAHRWHASMTLAVSMMDADRFAEAENVLGEGRRRCEDFGVRWPVPLYQWGVVWLSFRTGAWDAALSKAQSGFALIEEVPFRFGAVSAHAVVAMIAVRRNDLLAAESALAAADAELARTGPQYLYEWRPWAAALVTEALGDTAGAVHAMAQAWSVLTASDVRVGFAELGGDYVRLLMLAGDEERARCVTEQVEDVARRMGTPSALGTALRCRGLVERDPGPLARAVDVLEDGPRPLLFAQACEDAASVFAQAGDEASAAAFLGRAADAYASLGATRDVGRVRAVMRDLGIPAGRRGPRRDRPKLGWDSLTSTEREVSRLAIEGLTNREIAERMYISPRTAETHLRHVFAKLEVPSRRELRRRAAVRQPEEADPQGPRPTPAAGRSSH